MCSSHIHWGKNARCIALYSTAAGINPKRRAAVTIAPTSAAVEGTTEIQSREETLHPWHPKASVLRAVAATTVKDKPSLHWRRRS
jgi:hypothetical protein